MRVLKNERVKDILKFIDKFTVCDITQIARLFYSKNKCSVKDAQLKMTNLAKEKTVKRKRNDVNSKYIYYLEKEPAQIWHKLLLTEFYVKLCEKYGMDNVNAELEYTGVQSIRPDGYFRIRDIKNNRLLLYFVEVQISNNPCDTQKYEKVFKNKWHTNVFQEHIFPTIIFVTDKNFDTKSEYLEFRSINTNFDNVFAII